MKIKTSNKNGFLSISIYFIIALLVSSYSSRGISKENVKHLPNGSIIAAQMGIMQFVIVPLKYGKHKAFHVETIKILCPVNKTCFLNFFTNSKNAEISSPLNDSILNEPTLIYRRSSKHQNATFQWSCRLKLAITTCF